MLVFNCLSPLAMNLSYHWLKNIDLKTYLATTSVAGVKMSTETDIFQNVCMRMRILKDLFMYIKLMHPPYPDPSFHCF